MIQVGEIAPDFTLFDQNHRELSLSKYRGERSVMLVFFPLAFTGNCEGELSYLRDRLPDFETEDSAVVALSVGPTPTHKVWSAEQGYLFPILADFWPHGAVARQYGVFNEDLGYANRGTFVIGKSGEVLYASVNEPRHPRDQATWEKARSALIS